MGAWPASCLCSKLVPGNRSRTSAGYRWPCTNIIGPQRTLLPAATGNRLRYGDGDRTSAGYHVTPNFGWVRELEGPKGHKGPKGNRADLCETTTAARQATSARGANHCSGGDDDTDGGRRVALWAPSPSARRRRRRGKQRPPTTKLHQRRLRRREVRERLEAFRHGDPFYNKLVPFSVALP